MAEYIQLKTLETSFAVLYDETSAGSNVYDETPFVPATFSFEFNPDSPTSLRNITMLTTGTPMTYTDANNWGDTISGKVHYIQSYDGIGSFRNYRDVDLGTSDGDRLLVSSTVTKPVTWRNWYSGTTLFNYGSSNSIVKYYIGGAMFNEYNIFVIIAIGETSSGSRYTSSKVYMTNDVNNATVVKRLQHIFYSSDDLDTYTIKRLTPENSYFKPGQSSTLSYAIVNGVGQQFASEFTLEPSLGTGWGYEDGVLTFYGGGYRSFIKVTTTYDNIVYTLNDVFYPESGSTPYQPGGTSGIGGGGGNFGQGVPNDNVSIDTPSGSNFGYVGGSMFTHYALSGNQVENFGEWLWTDNLGLSLWKTVMEKIFNETADGLIGLMAFPFNISTLPNIALVDGTIKAGNLPTGIPARILQSPYTQVDWGTIQLTEYWGNFLDYAPHTKIELYLPWSTGFVPIDPHQCLPGSLSVKTNIDLQKGTCTHNVFAGTTVLGVYEGQVGYEIPLLASNFSAKLAGATVTAVAGLAMGAAGAGAAASTAIKTASAAGKFGAQMQAFKATSGVTDPSLIAQYSQSLANIMKPNLTNEAKTFAAITTGSPAKLASAASSATAKQAVNVSRNGSFSGSSAGMSIPYPYVIISRPEQNIPVGYGHFFGYPSNIGIPNSRTPNLGALKGYTEIGAIHLNGIQAVPDELAELDDILKGGFII